jgi:hypothetical protein
MSWDTFFDSGSVIFLAAILGAIGGFMAHREQTIYRDDRIEALKRIEQGDFALPAIQRGVRLASRTDQRTIRQPEKVDHRDMVWRPDKPRRVQKNVQCFSGYPIAPRLTQKAGGLSDA